MYLMDYELNPQSIIELHRQPHIHPDLLPPTPQSPGFPVFPPTRKQSLDDSHTRLRIWKDKNDPRINDMAAATTVTVYPVHPALFEALTGVKVKGRASVIPDRSSGERRLSEASTENETCSRCKHRRSEYRLRPCQHSCCHECLADVLTVSPPEKNCWTCQAVAEGIH
ncbi:hypothetical protein SAICODRAFT_29211 [Saitoella complicata NRRL Y-17804]|nr:uncharacterized protein SAICODRAFT_29211 [Saitoella complicata NRRL Y-17804]ODQ55014.1 hypothetical protein SAICODRAFT_29211 [Saitoella complicata NRRL Y-17804]